MADVLLSTDDLVVLGGPAKISLDVDFGPEGERGSLIFVGEGKPGSSEDGLPDDSELKAQDLYLNVDPTDDEYQFMYQYLSEVDGTFNWTKVLRLSPTIYSYNKTVTFDINGSLIGTINIDLFNFISEELIGTYSAENFNVQVNLLSENPISLGTSIGDIVEEQVLPISLTAIEYVSGAWQPLTGSQTVHILVTLKNNIS